MEKREQPSGHLNLQTAVVAGTPLFDGVQSAHLDALVEAARGENEVKLVVASRLWVLTGEVVRHDVTGVGGFSRCQRLRLPAIRQLRPHELQPNGLHPVEHGR